MNKYTYTTLSACLITIRFVSAQVTYIDAVADPTVGTVNTTATSGAELSTWYAELNQNVESDLWNRRTGFANPADGGDIFQGRSSAPVFEELKTTITGLTEGQEYEFYVFFWDAGGQAWTVDAGLTSGDLTTYSGPEGGIEDSSDGLASSLTYSEDPVFVGSNLVMHFARLGRVTADASGEVSIFVNNSVAGEFRRTWYDGVGFKAITDSDNDGMEDSFELQIVDADPDDAITSIEDVLPGDDFDSDNATNLAEFEFNSQDIDPDQPKIELDPTNPDTDGDTLLDGDELAGTSNAFEAGTPTNPVDADSDDDTLNDFEENGSLNTQFANAPTDPNNEDTDGDLMFDGYEVSNNTPGTALNANDSGTDDEIQDPEEDIDGDGVINIDEHDGFYANVQTRADLADTDGDGYTDLQEINDGFWDDSSDPIITGTHPLLTDTDGDCLLDFEEQFTSPGASPTTAPYNSDPNVADTDDDGFSDFLEVKVGGTDPDDSDSFPDQSDSYILIEDFEGDGMEIGQSFIGVNGWVANDGIGVVADEPIAGGDQVGSWLSGTVPRGTIYRSLSKFGAEILDASTGTLFFQIYTENTGINHSIGLSAADAPVFWTSYEAQFALVPDANNLLVRDGAESYRYPNGDHPVGQWMNVWVVANNDTDETKVYVESPDGATGQIDITPDDDPAAPYSFRNGTLDSLDTFLLIENSVGNFPVLIDNIYINPTIDAHLITPAAAKPVVVEGDGSLQVTNIVFDGGGLKVTFSPGGDGFLITSADDLAGGFNPVATATYDGVNTFTIPAAELDADGNDFFRVEAAPQE